MKLYGKVTGPVNNAGVTISGLVTDIDAEKVVEGIRINKLGQLLGMKYAVPALRRNGGGVIIKANSFGRNFQDTTEGISMPTSVIVAGYGKPSQIQRLPFKTYYSKNDEIAGKADAFLFLGYGFNHLHLNNFLHTIRAGNGKKPAVVVDWASDNQELLQFRDDQWSYNVCKTIPVSSREMATRQFRYAATDIGDLKAKGEFEVSINPEYPLSIWYIGFIGACNNYIAIKSELEADN